MLSIFNILMNQTCMEKSGQSFLQETRDFPSKMFKFESTSKMKHNIKISRSIDFSP